MSNKIIINNENNQVTVQGGSSKVVTVVESGPRGPQGPSGSAAVATGSLLATASFSNPNIVFTKGDGSTFNVNLESLSADSEWFNGGTFLTSSKAVIITGSLTVSSSDTFTNIGPGIFEGDLTSSGTMSASFFIGDGSQLTNLPIQSILTASLIETASVSLNTITFTQGDGSTFPITVDTGSVDVPSTASLLTTASVANDTITFTKGDGSTFPIVIDNVSHSLEANDLVITVKNVSGDSLSIGTAVHAVGVTGENLQVVTASADDPNTMPAVAVLSQTIANNANGTAIISGRLTGLNTSNLVAGAPVYVNNGGLLTATKPTGSSLIQNVGICAKVNGTEGEVIIEGAGRSNAVPNLLENQIFFGTAGEVATQIHISGALDSTVINNVSSSGNISASGYVSASFFVGDGSQLTNLPLQSSLTASLIETASVSLNTITFTKGDGTTFPILVNTGSVDVPSTGSLLETASVALNTITFTKGDGSTFPITVDTGSVDVPSTASLLETASVSLNTITFTQGDGSTFPIIVDTGSLAGDGSELTNLQRPISASVGTNLTASNINAGFFFEVGGATTCSIQTVANVTCDVGNEYEFFQTGSGNFLFETGSGVTMYSKNGLKLNGEFAACTLKHIKTDTWVLIGDLTT